MKALFDFLPIVLFFGAYKVYGIMVATAVAIAASVGMALYSYLKDGKVAPVHLMSAGVITVFGGATLYFANEWFIKVKPTVLYTLLAVVFLGSIWSKRTVTERMFSAMADSVPVAVLRRLNHWWVGFFLLLAGLNLFVAFRYDTDTWVNFKLFGLLSLTILFVLAQGLYLARVTTDDDPDELDGRSSDEKP